MQTQKNAFVSFLANDDFLPGVIALHNSLILFKHISPLVVLITEDVTLNAVTHLNRENISTIKVKSVENPKKFNFQTKFLYTYTKLRIFEMDDYQKIVYIDADIIVCKNIECLFDKPHMSAVAAGKFYYEDWTKFNAGMLVIVPNKTLFNDMLKLVPVLPSNGGDQGFLQSYYPDWENELSLHLKQEYNIPVQLLEVYKELPGRIFNYQLKALETSISMIHYWGDKKPWHMNDNLSDLESSDPMTQSLVLWWDIFKKKTVNIQNP